MASGQVWRARVDRPTTAGKRRNVSERRLVVILESGIAAHRAGRVMVAAWDDQFAQAGDLDLILDAGDSDLGFAGMVKLGERRRVPRLTLEKLVGNLAPRARHNLQLLLAGATGHAVDLSRVRRGASPWRRFLAETKPENTEPC